MLKWYVKKLAETTIQGDAREESYYSHLSDFLTHFATSIGKKHIHITTLPKKTEAGNPDFRIWDGKQHIVGYIEAKIPGTNLNQIEGSEQLERYRNTFPNLILTDFYEFRLYRDGKRIESTFIGRPFVAQKLHVPSPVEYEPELTHLLEKFFAFALPKVFTAESLAIELAKRTRFLRDEVIRQELEDEEHDSNEVIGFFEAFQKYLIAGLTKEEFADLYAQTITYGLFAARTRADEHFNRRLAFNFIPPTIGILRDVFQFISLGTLPQQMEVIIDDIAEVLHISDIAKILHDYYKDGRGEDPIIHFYETFLNQYDPETREKRGVYYTPEPVVNYIVRSINYLLINDFEKEHGFANTDVTVLDPSGGTLTFLAQTTKLAIEQFIHTFGDGHKTTFIQEHILQHFYAFELMMAPYAIAHLKMSFLLDECGYKMQDKDRFKLYLTNTLETEQLEQTKMPGIASLAEESKQATLIKKAQPILAIMGNPPYSVASYNKSPFIDEIMALYKRDVKDEKNIQLLSDDYAKFIRFCHWKIEQAGHGVIGLITKNTYLNTTAFKGLRKRILAFFDKVYVYNLHGKLYEKTPDGGKDQNVFDIRVGTAILLLVKNGSKGKRRYGQLFYRDFYGTRHEKYEFLGNNHIESTVWEEIPIDTQYFFFEKKCFSHPELYNSFCPIDEIFDEFSTGVETRRDHITLQDSLDGIKSIIRNFIQFDVETINNTYKTGDTRDWKTAWAKHDITKNKEKDLYIEYAHKPFSRKYTFYTGKSKGFMGTPANAMMKHFLLIDNLGFILKKRHADEKYTHCFCTNSVTDRNFLGGQSYIFPLYRYPEQADAFKPKDSNLDQEFEAFLQNAYSQSDLTEPIFYYIYAILHSTIYRESFPELLKIGFPRIPFTENYELFIQFSDLGKALVELHLLQSESLSQPFVRFQGTAEPGEENITGIEYDPEQHILKINKTQYFDHISPEIWEYEVGKNKVTQRWIKQKIGLRLSLNQSIEFCQIATAIHLTLEIQQKIDELYKVLESSDILIYKRKRTKKE